jgi:hypothetical protein
MVIIAISTSAHSVGPTKFDHSIVEFVLTAQLIPDLKDGKHSAALTTAKQMRFFKLMVLASHVYWVRGLMYKAEPAYLMFILNVSI